MKKTFLGANFIILFFISQNVMGQPFGKFASFDGNTYCASSYNRFDSEEMTVEFWVKLCSPNEVYFMEFLAASNVGVNYSSGTLRIKLGTKSFSTNLPNYIDIEDGNWHHIAVCVKKDPSFSKDFAWWYMVDGQTVYYEDRESLQSFLLTSWGFNIGINKQYTNAKARGSFQIDEVRISKNIRYPFNTQKYTADFIPSKTAFKNDQFTHLLIDFEGIDIPDYINYKSSLALSDRIGNELLVYGNLVIRTDDQIIRNKADLPKTICFGDSFMIEATGGNKINWQPKAFFIDASERHTWAKPTSSGYLKVKIFDTASCETSIDSFYINVKPKNFGVNNTIDSICLGDTSVFSQVQPSNLGTFYWSTQTGSIPSPTNWLQEFSPKKSTTYYLNLSNSGCNEVLEHKVIVLRKSELSIIEPDQLCYGDSIELILDSASNINWSSNYKIANTSFDRLKIAIDKALHIDVSYKNRYGCTLNETVERDRRKFANPRLDDSIMCSGNWARLYAYEPHRGNVQWYSRNNPKISVQCCPNIPVPKESTWYYVESSFNNGCTDKDSVFLKIITLDSLKLNTSVDTITMCEEDTFTFTYTSNYEVTWSSSISRIDSTTMQIRGVNFSGPVIGQIKLPGCTLRKEIPIIRKPFTGTFSSISSTYSTVCRGDIITLKINKPDSFKWVFAPGAQSNLDSHTITYRVDSYHVVVLRTFDENSCTRTLYQKLKLANKEVELVKPEPICKGDSILLDANLSYAYLRSAIWEPASIVKEHNNEFYTYPSKSQILKLIYPTNGPNKTCYDTTILKLEVSTDLKAFAGKDTSVVIGNEISLSENVTATGGYAPYNFKWRVANGSVIPLFEETLYFSDERTPTVEVKGNVNYILEVEDKTGCTANDTIRVTTKKECDARISIGRKAQAVFSEYKDVDFTYQPSSTLQYFRPADFIIGENNELYMRIVQSLGIKSHSNKYYNYWGFDPVSIDINDSGVIYLADERAVYRLDPKDLSLNVFAGDPSNKGDVDGNLTTARFYNIIDMHIAGDNSIYVLDGQKIKIIENNKVSSVVDLNGYGFVREFALMPDGRIFFFNYDSGYSLNLTNKSGNIRQLTTYKGSVYDIIDGVGNKARMREVYDITAINDSIIMFFDYGFCNLRQYNIKRNEYSTVLDITNNIGLIDYFNYDDVNLTNHLIGGYSSLGMDYNRKPYLRVLGKIYELEWAPVLCRGQKVELNVKGNVSGANFLWADNSTSKKLKVSPLKSKYYTVNVSDGNCQSQLSQLVYIDHADIGEKHVICEKTGLVLGAGHSGGLYEWMPSTLNDGRTFEPKFRISDSTESTIVLSKTTSFCGTTYDSARLNIAIPKGHLKQKNYIVCKSDSIILKANGAKSYTWYTYGRVLYKGNDSSFSYLSSKENEKLFITMQDNFCTVNDTISIETQNLVPLRILGIDSSVYCPGDSLNLTANYKNGIWKSTLLTTDSSNHTQPIILTNTIEKVILYSTNSCYLPDTQYINTDTSSLRVLNGLNTRGFCSGDSLQLKIDDSFHELLWNNAYSGGEFYAKKSGNYFVSGLSAFNCPKKSDTIYINEWALPDTSLKRVGNLLIAKSGYGYKWFLDGKQIDGEFDDSLLTTWSGSYYAVYESANGCQSKTRSITILGLKNKPNKSVFDVYPNPAIDVVNIKTISDFSEVNMSIFNNSGQLILEKTLVSENTSVNTEEWPSGIYLVQLRTNQGVYFDVFVKSTL